MSLDAGSIIAGKYRVESILGVGGMGQVFLASHIHLQQQVAIKVLLAEMLSNQSTVERFLREAQSTVRLRGEHIARVIDVGTLGSGQPFMVMEYLDGADLGQILHHYGPQTPAVVVDLMLQACEGLSEAHAMGIVHRDLKPSNFFATRRPDGSTLLKILDFGISKGGQVAITDQTGTQTILGTPSYMAPEQMRQSRGADARSDIWSLGVVMYQLLSGALPFKADTFADLVIKACMEQPPVLEVEGAPGLAHIIMNCLEKEPSARPHSAVELAAMLAAYAADPVAAAATVERCRRVSQATATANTLMMNDPLRPMPLSLPPLTPSSWSKSQTNQGSVTGAAGQMSGQRQSTRTRVTIAGMAIVAIATGALLGTRSGKEAVSSTQLPPNAAPIMPPVQPSAQATAVDARPVDAAPKPPPPSPVAPTEPKIKVVDAKTGGDNGAEQNSNAAQRDDKSKRDKSDTPKDKDKGTKDAKGKETTKKPAKKEDELDFGSRK